ncbi:MAG: extracellular solute-binding protein [Lachnospiraceae bacterium]|nr:extracellular solute-binding protein [Lachnospiraceae bacterium]
MKKKKVLSLLLATAMAATCLTACGGNDTTTEPETETTEETGEETTEETTEEAGEETTEETTAADEEEITATIKVWSPSEDQSAENGNWLGTMCDAFNEAHPNWNLTFEYGVCAEADAKTQVGQDPTAAADVYFYANDQLTDLIAANGIAKLGGETENYVKETNSQAIVDSVTVDGAVYGVPFTTNTWFMYYDKSAFTEDEVKNLDTMLAKDKVSFPLNNSWYIASFYVANGCTLFGDGTDEAAGIDFGGDKGAAVTTYLANMVANPNFVNDKDGSGLAGLRDGSVKAMFSGSWDYAAVKEALGDNFGVTVLPSITINGEAKQMKSFAGSKAIGVNPNSQYPQVAVALAKFLGSADAQQSHYDLRSIVPCNTELLAQEAVQADALVVAQNATFDTTSILQPFVSKMGNYWTPAENFGNSLLNGEVTADNAAEMTESFNTSLNTSAVE